jgi:hypothetical protein
MRLGWLRCAPAERPLQMLATVGLKGKSDRLSGGSEGKPLTTTELVKHCYWFVGEEIKSWHRTNVTRVADLVANRIGRATSRGRPIMWSPRPKQMQDRRWVGHKRPGSSSQ